MAGRKAQIEPKSWDDLEQRPGFSGLRNIAERDTLPKLNDAIPRRAETSPINALYGGGCFVAAIGLVLLVALSSTFGPFGFVAAIIIGFFLARPSIEKIARFQIDRMIKDFAFQQGFCHPG